MTDTAAEIPPTARLLMDADALVSNWQVLDRMSGRASTGAAVKANAYGLGVTDVVQRLARAGCRDFFVANWQEAAEISALDLPAIAISVFNGVREEDMAAALRSPARPVLNSLAQVKRWAATERPCDVMIETGMNRLGIEMDDLAQAGLGKLDIDLVMSHLASADEETDQNADQLANFGSAIQSVEGRRLSLANSAGIALGEAYHFDCTRPGLSLYGGWQRPELEGQIRQVVFPQAQILQVRSLQPGEMVGYNATYVAQHAHDIAILGMGYADGYLRGFSGTGTFRSGDARLPVVGRVSMDLIAIDISGAPQWGEGDWVDCDFILPEASAVSGLGQYELITGLGNRLPRIWT